MRWSCRPLLGLLPGYFRQKTLECSDDVFSRKDQLAVDSRQVASTGRCSQEGSSQREQRPLRSTTIDLPRVLDAMGAALGHNLDIIPVPTKCKLKVIWFPERQVAASFKA